jgi:hypothetical protein
MRSVVENHLHWRLALGNCLLVLEMTLWAHLVYYIYNSLVHLGIGIVEIVDFDGLRSNFGWQPAELNMDHRMLKLKINIKECFDFV